MSQELDPSKLEIDLSYLNEIAGGDAEFMIEMIDIFIEQTPVYTEEMVVAVKECNWKAVADLAHKIKPTLAFMGVNKAKDQMGSIEEKARTGSNVEDIPAEFAEVKTVCENLYIGLHKIKAELQASL